MLRNQPKRPRKRRGIKKNGKPSYDLCPTCYSYNCDPIFGSRKFHAKIDQRLRLGLCASCGNKICSCKSTLSKGYISGKKEN